MTSDKTATQIADRLLAEHWSASTYVRELQNEQAAAQNILFILQDQELRKLEPLIKVRLLLAPLFLRKQEGDNLKDSLQVLADKLCLDDDDWVKVTAYAVGRYEGHLDLAGVLKASKAVSGCLSSGHGTVNVAMTLGSCLAMGCAMFPGQLGLSSLSFGQAVCDCLTCHVMLCCAASCHVALSCRIWLYQQYSAA